jgi:group I intron endonuclease
MKLCGIYLLTHSASGRKYVGQSVNIKNRISAHSRDVRQTRISAAIHKYGWPAFTAEILELCDPAQLNELEAKWIAHHDCISPKGFNMTAGGELRMPNSEARAKMSAAKQGSKMPEKTRAAINAANAGRRRTAESKNKTSEKLKGRQFSEETRRKMAESAKNRYRNGHGAVLVQRAAEVNRKNKLLRNNAAITPGCD